MDLHVIAPNWSLFILILSAHLQSTRNYRMQCRAAEPEAECAGKCRGPPCSWIACSSVFSSVKRDGLMETYENYWKLFNFYLHDAHIFALFRFSCWSAMSHSTEFVQTTMTPFTWHTKAPWCDCEGYSVHIHAPSLFTLLRINISVMNDH